MNYGSCPVCGRTTALMDDGRIRNHGKGKTCPGWGQLPKDRQRSTS